MDDETFAAFEPEAVLPAPVEAKKKGRAKGYKVVKKPDPLLSALSTRLDSLVDIVSALAEKVMTPQPTLASDITGLTTGMAQEVSPVARTGPATAMADLPAPLAWADKMREILGNDFEMEVVDGGSGDFVIKIYVPEYLKRDKTIIGRDHSSGLVRRASALQDVEMWCLKIRDNIKKVHPSFKETIKV